MPNIPKTIPKLVLKDIFSLPSAKFSSKTHNGDRVEMSDAKPLEMYFSENVVNPFARTIIIIDKIKARNNCVFVISLTLPLAIKKSKIKVPDNKLRMPATKNGGIVSTAILIPKKVVPQKKATQKTDKYSLVFKI